MVRTLTFIGCLMFLASGCTEIAPSTSDNPFIQQSVEGLQALTATHSATWHLGEEEEWAVDQDTGRITFTFADGTVAEADMQIVGTYNTDDGTFLWGWDHPSVQPPLDEHAKLAKKFGEENNLPKFTQRKVHCTEDEAWQFTAVAVRLGEANGAYRGPTGPTLVFMTFDDVDLRKP